jgi:hypothetical protein
MAQLWKKITEHPFITTTAAIILFIAAIWPVFVSHETIPDYLDKKGWAVTMPPWYYIFALTLSCVIVVLQITLIRTIRASKKDVSQNSPPPPTSFPLFYPSYFAHTFLLRASDGKQYVFDPTTSQTGVLILQITATFTAIPDVMVEQIFLEIVNKRLPSQ